MSNVSNRHSVIPFIATESKPLSGQRLAKVGYKQTAKMTAAGEVAPKSVCVSVPVIPAADIETYWEALVPHVRTLLENAQDGIVRSLYESRKFELSSVSDEDISVPQCINFLESEANGGRLTKEYLETWFMNNVRDNLFVMIAEKLGFEELSEENTVVIEQHVNSYKGIISSLSSGKTSLSAQQINGIRRAFIVSAVNDEDETLCKLNKKLDDMEKAQQNMLFAL